MIKIIKIMCIFPFQPRRHSRRASAKPAKLHRVVGEYCNGDEGGEQRVSGLSGEAGGATHGELPPTLLPEDGLRRHQGHPQGLHSTHI